MGVLAQSQPAGICGVHNWRLGLVSLLPWPPGVLGRSWAYIWSGGLWKVLFSLSRNLAFLWPLLQVHRCGLWEQPLATSQLSILSIVFRSMRCRSFYSWLCLSDLCSEFWVITIRTWGPPPLHVVFGLPGHGHSLGGVDLASSAGLAQK